MTDKILRIPDAEYVNIIRIVFTDHPTEDIRTYLDSDLEPAPPKDWAQQMKDLEERNIRLSRFIMDWLGRELEKALLKSWRPICYDSQYNKLNGCDPVPPVIKTCQQCPFLADRHKSKVK